ncbi:MAG TPA: 3-hydroxyacyl-CoA dehydrogenase NAD-binding domain-containing protein [Bacteroidia bacterium]
MNNLNDIKTVGIAGAGTMGAGIAQVCSQAAYKVILFDLNEQVLAKAKSNMETALQKLESNGKIGVGKSIEILQNILFTSQINDLKADLIIEAIIEKTEVKISLFEQLIELNGNQTIYATNTSSIPITKIAAGISMPERLVGIHFFNPAQIMKLVEVIKGAKSDPALIAISGEFVKKLGKVPVFAADSPGFIVNRVARLYYVESLKMLEEGVASLETIDNIMESSGFKMGPFKLMDLIGVDTNYSVTESQYQLFNHEARFRPSRIQKQKVDAGQHGRKTKQGFYNYE